MIDKYSKQEAAEALKVILSNPSSGWEPLKEDSLLDGDLDRVVILWFSNRESRIAVATNMHAFKSMQDYYEREVGYPLKKLVILRPKCEFTPNPSSKASDLAPAGFDYRNDLD